MTPLAYVCKTHGENSKLVEAIIDAGGDVNSQDHDGLTPLDEICRSLEIKLELAKTLIGAGDLS